MNARKANLEAGGQGCLGDVQLLAPANARSKSGTLTIYWRKAPRVGWSWIQVPLSIEKPECSQPHSRKEKSGLKGSFWRNRTIALFSRVDDG